MSQIICPISGEILLKSDLLLGMNFRCIHPFLQAKKEIILSPDIIFRFQFAKSEREKRLYYLAILNTSELVDFRCPAQPNAWIMEATFFELATLVQWIDYAKYQQASRGDKGKIKFPRYAIDRENRELKNIGIWLGEIRDIRNLFIKKSEDEDLKKELIAKAADIEREWKRASVFGQAFTPLLAKWALEMAGVEEGMYDIWKEMLLTPLEDAWTLNKKDLEELLDHFQAELPINNDSVNIVLKQIKLLMGKNSEGYEESWVFVEPDEELAAARKALAMKDGNEQAAQQVEGDEHPAPMNNNDVIIDIGPEPLRHQFSKSWEYTRAKAKYEMLKREAKNGKPRGEFKQF
jgi:hypothetical protein